jgi:hypothetical protein
MFDNDGNAEEQSNHHRQEARSFKVYNVRITDKLQQAPKLGLANNAIGKKLIVHSFRRRHCRYCHVKSFQLLIVLMVCTLLNQAPREIIHRGLDPPDGR